MFDQDIIIDQEKFNTAIEDYAALSVRLQKLTTTVNNMLSELESGFNTPAGATFLNACSAHLLTPLEQQQEILKHISDTLMEVRTVYQPVFTKYQELTDAINRMKQN